MLFEGLEYIFLSRIWFVEQISPEVGSEVHTLQWSTGAYFAPAGQLKAFCNESMNQCSVIDDQPGRQEYSGRFRVLCIEKENEDQRGFEREDRYHREEIDTTPERRERMGMESVIDTDLSESNEEELIRIE